MLLEESSLRVIHSSARVLLKTCVNLKKSNEWKYVCFVSNPVAAVDVICRSTWCSVIAHHLPQRIVRLMLEDNSKDKLLIFLHILEGSKNPVPDDKETSVVLVQNVDITTWPMYNKKVYDFFFACICMHEFYILDRKTCVAIQFHHGRISEKILFIPWWTLWWVGVLKIYSSGPRVPTKDVWIHPWYIKLSCWWARHWGGGIIKAKGR